MSNPIRYDSLLVGYLARALHERLAGRACHASVVRSGDRAAALPLDGGRALHFDLSPGAGWVRMVPWTADPPAPANAEIVQVSAPDDERWFAVEIRGGSRFRPVQRRLVAELQTNHWNLLVVDGDGRIVFALHPRDVGGRTLRPGAEFRPPEPQPRIGPSTMDRGAAWAEWDVLLATAPAADRIRTVQRRFARLGPLNAGAVLGADRHAPMLPVERRAAFDRWWQLCLDPPANPVLLLLPRGPHPYPLPLPDVPSEPVSDLLRAMELAATAEPVAPAEERAAPWLSAIEARLRQARARLESLRQEQGRAGEADRARHFGDLLLARLAQVPRGASVVRIADWDDTPVDIPLDLKLAPAENATRWYDVARRRQRAAERLPHLVRTAEREVEQWEARLAAAHRGELPEPLLKELKSATRSVPVGAQIGERLPYRLFRTSGGIEVRVGRGSSDNDRLTFGHSRPDDIWLHARSVPGSHVILRWQSAEHAPPARDLAEAAGLAGWFSKARTSGLVAVDWTRRKHVRKPRGAPPGSVVPQRVKTVFVEPDADLQTRLSDEPFAPVDEDDGAPSDAPGGPL